MRKSARIPSAHDNSVTTELSQADEILEPKKIDAVVSHMSEKYQILAATTRICLFSFLGAFFSHKIDIFPETDYFCLVLPPPAL